MAYNVYYNCLTEDGAPVAWDPPDEPEQWVWGESVYFGKVLRHLDEHLGDRGLTIYLTSSSERLPSYGPNVVAVVVADELYRIPRYVDRVGAVFKNHGVIPRLGCRPLSEPSLVNLRTLFVFINRWIRYMPSAFSYVGLRTRSAVSRRRVAPLYEIPVGTFNQRALPVPPILDRPIDVFFGGSVNQGHLPGTPRPPWWEDYRERLGPKAAAREAMIANMQRLRAGDPRLSVELLEAPSYLDALDADPDVYSRRLVDAKISLVPRGTSPQTFRLFQSLRAGCVVITDVLPSHWFSAGAPVIRLGRWSELSSTVESLIADPGRLLAKHQQSLAWWESRCSERAVAEFMARRLRSW